MRIRSDEAYFFYQLSNDTKGANLFKFSLTAFYNLKKGQYKPRRIC